MFIKQGQTIDYENEKWNLQIAYKHCNIKNRQLLSVKNGGNKIINIVCNDTQVEVSVLFDAKEIPIKLIGIPADLNNVNILVCNTQNRIALYVNDKLHDEDWQLGQVRFEGGVCDYSLGEWIIHDDFSFNKNYSAGYGEIKNIQNWHPDGHNTGVGDCMPFSHGGAFHLFYLFDRRGHGSKWGLGAHQWAHISTKDFINWIEHPMALAIDEKYEGSICTGSVVCYNGLYYAFYAVRMSDGSPARLTWATSPDCINFEKSNKYFELSAKYDKPSARDPMVFIGDDGIANMFVTTSVSKDKDNKRKGCLAHLISTDMLIWKETDPIVILDTGDQPECPDYFELNGWYYLIYSVRGQAHYFMSRNPFGPWEAPANNILISPDCRVPKTAKFGDRIMAAGFFTPHGRGYAGYVHFNEMMQQSDGTFKFAVPKELL